VHYYHPNYCDWFLRFLFLVAARIGLLAFWLNVQMAESREGAVVVAAAEALLRERMRGVACAHHCFV